MIKLIYAPNASSDPGRTKASAQVSNDIHLILGSSDSKNITKSDSNYDYIGNPTIALVQAIVFADSKSRPI